MMVLQHRKSVLWYLTIYSMHANVGIFSLSYAVVPSFLVSVFFIDPYFIFKFNILVRRMLHRLGQSNAKAYQAEVLQQSLFIDYFPV